MSRVRGLVVAGMAGASMVLPMLIMGGSSLPSTDTQLSPRTTINALVVKSWGNCSSNSLIWDSVNSNWQNYGSVAISIDYSYTGLCHLSDTVTLSALEASGADVVILSDPSGNHAQFSSDEAEALRQYANQGHNLIGTYLLLQYDTSDNRVLAPLFGLEPSRDYLLSGAITPTFDERDPTLALFRNVGDPYVSSGYPYTQQPADGLWQARDLTTANLVARTSDSQAAILVQRASAALAYSSIYISNMPEYGGSPIDEQLFYNAIIFPASG
jgi:hypothetical protein